MGKRKFSKLRGRLCEADIKQKEIAKLTGNGATTISHKFNGFGASEWTVREAYTILDALEIDHSQIDLFFPPDDVLNK
jgi:hypothetical protein